MYCDLRGFQPCGFTIKGIRRILFFEFGHLNNFSYLPQNDFYISEYDNQSNPYEYKPNIEGDVSSSINLENGSKQYAHRLTFFVPKMEYLKNSEFSKMGKRQFHAIIEDRNGNCWLMGEDNPLVINSLNTSLGKGGDNGYQMEFVTISKKLLSEISCFDGLCRATLRGTEERTSVFVIDDVSLYYPMGGAMQIVADAAVRNYVPTGFFNPTLWGVPSIKAADVAKLTALISGTGDGFISLAQYDLITDKATIIFSSSNTSFDELTIGTAPVTYSSRSIQLRLETVFANNIGQNSTFSLYANSVLVQSGASQTVLSTPGYNGILSDFYIDVLTLFPSGATFEMQLSGAGCPDATYVYVYEPLTTCRNEWDVFTEFIPDLIEVFIDNPTIPHILTINQHQILIDVSSTSLYQNEVITQLTNRGISFNQIDFDIPNKLLKIKLNSNPNNSFYRVYVDYPNLIGTSTVGGMLKKAFKWDLSAPTDTTFATVIDPVSNFGGTVSTGVISTNNVTIPDALNGDGSEFYFLGGTNVNDLQTAFDSPTCGTSIKTILRGDTADCPYWSAGSTVFLSHFEVQLATNERVNSITLTDGTTTIIPIIDGLLGGNFNANNNFLDYKIDAFGKVYVTFFASTNAATVDLNTSVGLKSMTKSIQSTSNFNLNGIAHPFEVLQTQIPNGALNDTFTIANLMDKPAYFFDSELVTFATESYNSGTGQYDVTFVSPTVQGYTLQLLTAAGVVAVSRSIPAGTTLFSANITLDLLSAGVSFAALTLRKLKGQVNENVVYQIPGGSTWSVVVNKYINHRIDRQNVTRRRYLWQQSANGYQKVFQPFAAKASICPDFYPALLGTTKLRFWGQQSGLNFVSNPLPQTCTITNGSIVGTVNGGVYNIGNRLRINGVNLRIVNVVGTTLTFGQPYLGASGTYAVNFERVSSWADASGNGLLATAGVTGGGTQIASSKRDWTDERNGVFMSPVQYFSTAATVTNPNKLTFIAVAQNEGTNNSILFAHRSSNNALIQLFIDTNNIPRGQMRDSAGVTLTDVTAGTAIPNGYNIFTLDFQQNTPNEIVEVWANGDRGNRGTGTFNYGGNFNASLWTIGGTNNGSFQAGYGGNLIEFVILHDATLADIQKIEGYLRWKYNTTLNLHPTHPFANARPPQ